MYVHTKYYVVLHDLAVAQPQMALNVIIVKGFFFIDLDSEVCHRDLNEGQFTYIEYEISCCGGIMLCLAISIVV